MDALELLETLKGLKIKDIATEAAQEAEPYMVDAMQDQLSRGVRADDSEIAPPYTRFTIFLKEQKSGLASVTDVVTLFDTGAHYAALFADVKGSVIEYGSKDPKSPKLQDKYGDMIYGLTEDSVEGVIEDFLDERFKSKIERLTGLICT